MGRKPGLDRRAERLDWKDWYNVTGIYLDQMYNEEYSYTGTYIPAYYHTLYEYVKSIGISYVFGNSGADIPYYFIGSVSTIGYFENSYLPSLAVLGGWHTNYTKGDFAYFTYNQPSLNPYYIAASSDYVGSLFITNGERPFPYNALPPYFDQLMSDLASLVPVTVQTELINGTSVPRGFDVTVTQPDGISTTAHAPSTFDVVAGSTVTVSVRDFGGYVFSHWRGRSTGRSITIKPTAATTLVAYSSTNSTDAYLVTVRTNETNGIPVQGIWTTAWVGGKLVASGYTPFTFVATRGVNYTLLLQDYETYTFVSWAAGPGGAITIVPECDVLLYGLVTNRSSTQSASSG